jgi:hypothetical protein
MDVKSRPAIDFQYMSNRLERRWNFLDPLSFPKGPQERIHDNIAPPAFASRQ